MKATIKELRKVLKEKEKQGYLLDSLNVVWEPIETPGDFLGYKNYIPGPEIQISIVLRKI